MQDGEGQGMGFLIEGTAVLPVIGSLCGVQVEAGHLSGHVEQVIIAFSPSKKKKYAHNRAQTSMQIN